MGCSGSRSNKANEIAIKAKGETDTKSNVKEGANKQGLDSVPGSESQRRDNSVTPGQEKSTSLKLITIESQATDWLDSIYASVKSQLIVKL